MRPWDTNTMYAEKVSSNVSRSHLLFALNSGAERIHDAAAATGDYVAALRASGRTVTGSDLNSEYVSIARDRGLPVTQQDATSLALEDNSVDAVMLFEVIEHVADREIRLAMFREAARVARSHVLITTPNSSQLEFLGRCGLTYEHMLDRDHKVFFDEASLRAELDPLFAAYTIQEREPVVARLLPEIVDGATMKRLTRRGTSSRTREIYRWYFVDIRLTP